MHNKKIWYLASTLAMTYPMWASSEDAGGERVFGYDIKEWRIHWDTLPENVGRKW